ncbi:MAG: hypothetical protein ISR83_03380 [Candidatus Marinimicrobia bacterium]|nr:hypothetical protein [Candidatus Neomarinimicrobiota bacterium]
MTILNKQIIIIVLLSIVNFVYGEVEKVEKRTHFSKTYSLGNDRYRVEYSSKPIHYQGSNGNYIDIPLNDSEEYMSIALDQLDETYSSVSGSYQRIERLTSNTYDNSIFSYVGNTLFSVDDSAEEYTDENGNGQWDDAEPLTDIDGNEVWDDDEEFVDENNNGVWDEGESYIDENGNGQYDLAEEYVDTDSSGHWDDAEIFNDTNENGIWDTVVENVVWRNYNQFSNGVLIEPVENGDIYFDEIEIIVDPQYISIPDDTSNFGDISIQAGFIEFGNIFPEPSPNENNWFNLGSMEYNISSFNPAVPLDDDEFRWIINGDLFSDIVDIFKEESNSDFNISIIKNDEYFEDSDDFYIEIFSTILKVEYHIESVVLTNIDEVDLV